MSKFTGYLIRRERLAKNLSQEGLAKGICAVSYLSKIEQGLVEPGQEIIDRLFAALQIDFVRDPELEAEAARQLERFFFLIEADEPYEEQKAFFEQHGERLLRSEFALSYGVYRLCRLADLHLKAETRACFEQLQPFLECMEPRIHQEALFAIGRKTENPQEAAEFFTRAARLEPNCVILSTLANCMSAMGQYGKSMELTEQALALAFEQGNVLVMIRSCLRLGSNACSRYEMDQAKRYYARAIALSRGYRKDFSKYVYYNLGSTYLELGRMDEARFYLEQTEEDESNDQHNLLLHQKRAILHALQGKYEEARKEAAAAKRFLEKAERLDVAGGSLFYYMVRFAELMAEGEEKNPAEYEEVVRMLYAQTLDAFGFSYRQFYGRYYVELLKRQRRYKEALRIQEEMGFPQNNQ